ncbi:hypothetical protein BDR26DRAFT_4638 [Obelidium mucronatum]|nr:hypothetical protein BDR26DRAFT_4638 [Obelidium mucronatum]
MRAPLLLLALATAYTQAQSTQAATAGTLQVEGTANCLVFSGSSITLANCDSGNLNQLVSLSSPIAGKVRIQQGTKCANVANGSKDAGAKVVTWGCNTGTEDSNDLFAVSPSTGNDKLKFIYTAKPTLCLHSTGTGIETQFWDFLHSLFNFML